MTSDVTGRLSPEVLTAAEQILGWRLRTEFEGRPTEIMLTEVEAYAGVEDPASHAYRGETRRNRSLFAGPGTLYVYLSYGIHWCMNVVIGDEGTPNALLLRGGEATEGRELMVDRRGRDDHLTDGPGKLAQALGVTGDHDGTDLSGGPVRLLAAELASGWRVVATPRIGISKATDRPWRFLATPCDR